MNAKDTKPYTTYWYYKTSESSECRSCNSEYFHYLLRYRIFIGSRFPIIPAGSHYYLVCSNCGFREQLSSEVDVVPILSNLKNRKPIKYNKNSILNTLFNDEENEFYNMENELSKYIQIHLREMEENIDSL